MVTITRNDLINQIKIFDNDVSKNSEKNRHGQIYFYKPRFLWI